MNSAEKGIMGMLHRQAILARSKEMFIHELQIQGPSIDIIGAIRYSLLSIPPPPVAGGAFQSCMELRRVGHLMRRRLNLLWCYLWGGLRGNRMNKGLICCRIFQENLVS